MYGTLCRLRPATYLRPTGLLGPIVLNFNNNNKYFIVIELVKVIEV